MNIIELAKESGFTPSLIYDAENRFNLLATAIIEDYKAGLVPVYGIFDSETFVSIEETEAGALRLCSEMNRLCSEMNKHDDCNYSFVPLYALGETK